MQRGVTNLSPEGTFASTTTPYFQLTSSGGIPPGNVDIQGNLGVTGDAIIDGAITVGTTSSLINLAGPGNLIGAGPANVTIASDAQINLVPGVGSAVVMDGAFNCSGVVTSRFGNAAQTSLLGSGKATILSGTTFITVPFTGMTANGKILATITGNFNGAGAISAVPDANVFYIYSDAAVSANTNIFWMVIGLA
jgi:hypothetical protein